MADSSTLVQATSAGIERDGSTYVVLQWEAVHGVAGYNLYRRPAEGPARTSRPSGGQGVSPLCCLCRAGGASRREAHFRPSVVSFVEDFVVAAAFVQVLA